MRIEVVGVGILIAVFMISVYAFKISDDVTKLQQRGDELMETNNCCDTCWNGNLQGELTDEDYNTACKMCHLGEDAKSSATNTQAWWWLGILGGFVLAGIGLFMKEKEKK